MRRFQPLPNGHVEKAKILHHWRIETAFALLNTQEDFFSQGLEDRLGLSTVESRAQRGSERGPHSEVYRNLGMTAACARHASARHNTKHSLESH